LKGKGVLQSSVSHQVLVYGPYRGNVLQKYLRGRHRVWGGGWVKHHRRSLMVCAESRGEKPKKGEKERVTLLLLLPSLNFSLTKEEAD